jgi:sec-independent protein translocase protein TatA
MPMLNPWEIIIILIILVVIFGASRLSQFGGALGKSIREFRSAVHDEPSGTATAASTATPELASAAEAATAEPDIACPTCQALNPPTQKFCGKCGARISTPVAVPAAVQPAIENTCPSCATVNPAGQAFCGQCGTRLTRAA